MDKQLEVLLNQFNISFQNIYFEYALKYKKKCLGGGFAHFLSFLIYHNDINQMIIDHYRQNKGDNTIDIKDVLDSEGIYSAWLVDDKADIYGSLPSDDHSKILQSIQLEEFKAVLNAWKNF